MLKFISERQEIHPKMFEPHDIIQINSRHRRSATKLPSEPKKEKNVEKSSSIKMVLNKNFEFKEKKEEEVEPIFKNNFLKGLGW